MKIFMLKVQKSMPTTNTSQPPSHLLFRDVNMRNCLSGFGNNTKMWFHTVIAYYGRMLYGCQTRFVIKTKWPADKKRKDSRSLVNLTEVIIQCLCKFSIVFICFRTFQGILIRFIYVYNLTPESL